MLINLAGMTRQTGRGFTASAFCVIACAMKRVIVYVDGFNLYHAIADLKRPHLKWVCLRALAESLLRHGEVLKTVKYFSAYATWMPDRYQRHREYTDALISRGVVLHMGQFKEKPRKCMSCGARWMGHEEKETDVQIAVHMVADALKGEVDRLIVISADTDLGPAIKMILANTSEREVFVATPPGRFGYCRSLGPKLELTAGRLAKCLLPGSVQIGPGKTVKRPASYAPPA
ncbi:NYN domain-containing protein [Sphingobium sp. UBA5915]|uniref:NYN domain-containing protein n=1 Tax=Sphingobium sp. UBA5915 TaxID=1947530 RepID=UPI0025D43E48|nr:NYN domain-containing protein [Sphingobium sp. UBA5915]